MQLISTQFSLALRSLIQWNTGLQLLEMLFHASLEVFYAYSLAFFRKNSHSPYIYYDAFINIRDHLVLESTQAPTNHILMGVGKVADFQRVSAQAPPYRVDTVCLLTLIHYPFIVVFLILCLVWEPQFKIYILLDKLYEVTVFRSWTIGYKEL